MTLSQSQAHIASKTRFALTRQSRPKIQKGYGLGSQSVIGLAGAPARNSFHFIDWQ
jgi:hypothetical protein